MVQSMVGVSSGLRYDGEYVSSFGMHSSLMRYVLCSDVMGLGGQAETAE